MRMICEPSDAMNIRQRFRSYHCPRWEELPDLELYMDQVVTFLNQSLSLALIGEKAITPMMINNYVKQKALPAPVRKRYTREHLAHLVIIFILKKTMGLPDISGLMPVLKSSYTTLPEAYDGFCSAFEGALGWVCSEGIGEPPIRQNALLGASTISCAGKLYAQYMLKELEREDPAVKSPEDPPSSQE